MAKKKTNTTYVMHLNAEQSEERMAMLAAEQRRKTIKKYWIASIIILIFAFSVAAKSFLTAVFFIVAAVVVCPLFKYLRNNYKIIACVLMIIVGIAFMPKTEEQPENAESSQVQEVTENAES